MRLRSRTRATRRFIELSDVEVRAPPHFARPSLSFCIPSCFQPDAADSSPLEVLEGHFGTALWNYCGPVRSELPDDVEGLRLRVGAPPCGSSFAHDFVLSALGVVVELSLGTASRE